MAIDPTGMLSDEEYLEARLAYESEQEKQYQLYLIRDGVPLLSKTLGDLYWNKFTPRNREVYDYLAFYRADKDKVAKELGIKKTTVQKHRRKMWKYIQEDSDAIGNDIDELNKRLREVRKELREVTREMYNILVPTNMRN